MKFQDSSFNGLKVTVGTKSVTHARTHARSKSNKPHQLFQSWGINSEYPIRCRLSWGSLKIGRNAYELIKLTFLFFFRCRVCDKTPLWYNADPDLIRTGIGFVTILESNIFQLYHMSRFIRKPVFGGFPTRSDIKRAAQPQKMAKCLKFWI